MCRGVCREKESTMDDSRSDSGPERWVEGCTHTLVIDQSQINSSLSQHSLGRLTTLIAGTSQEQH